MADRHGGRRPSEAALRQVDRLEERRDAAERVDRRAAVVDEAGQRQLLRPEPAADAVRHLDDIHRMTGPGEADRCGEPVGAAPDDDRVRHAAGRSRSGSRTAGTSTPIGRRTHHAPVSRHSRHVVYR